jgi:hypothetical protein
MFGRNIDFFAVGVIAVVMLVFSGLASLRIDRVVGPMQLQNAVSSDSCPIDEVLSRISYILNESPR